MGRRVRPEATKVENRPTATGFIKFLDREEKTLFINYNQVDLAYIYDKSHTALIIGSNIYVVRGDIDEVIGKLTWEAKRTKRIATLAGKLGKKEADTFEELEGEAQDAEF